METDSIVAMVTPPGEGGVGIVRASGPAASTLPPRIFPQFRGTWRSHHARVGKLTDPRDGHVVDEALGLLMRAPRSYTGEDVFEIHCHGSPLVLEHVVRICLEGGCRAARPGEFTLRAFLNGRMDLTQAEAVVDVVRARSNAGLDLAVRQLSGWLSTRIAPIRTDLIGVLAHMEAMVDFVEDDIPPQADAATVSRLEEAIHALQAMLEGAEQGIVLREGATLAIAGSPNVGKSSIMNALLGLDRSIVTPIAGTTRDTVEETMQVRGVPFRTVDTAGITPTDDLVEGLGVKRSKAAIRGADVVLLVLDRSRPFNASDHLALEAVIEAHHAACEEGRAQRLVLALNKADLPSQLSLPLLDGLAPTATVDSDTVTAGGIETLREALERAVLGGDRREIVVANVRHRDAIQRAVGHLQSVLHGFETGIPLDLLSFDVRAAAQALGEITGENVDDELLDRIFRDFCIGK
jgi:tRNA modification GTPase